MENQTDLVKSFTGTLHIREAEEKAAKQKLIDAANAFNASFQVNGPESKAAWLAQMLAIAAKEQEMYDHDLRPILAAMAALPEKDGRKFTLWETPGKELDGPSVRLSYSHWQAPLAGPWMNIDFDIDVSSGKRTVAIYVNSRDSEKEKPYATTSEVVRLLAEWVNTYTPERILDIRAALEPLVAPEQATSGKPAQTAPGKLSL